MVCREFRKFTQWQVRRMRAAIDVTKWCASEFSGHDVGFHAAEQEFLERYQERLAKEWRLEYCNNICACRDDCELADAFEALEGY